MLTFQFRLILLSLLILAIDCQFGHPYVDISGEFSVECIQVESYAIQSPGTENYEVSAGKPFSYKCDFIVDTRKCESNPQSPGCTHVEMIWTLPSNLAKIQLEKGVTRKEESFKVESRDGFDKYRSWFNISEVGTIHDGEYNWKFYLKFEMRTVFEGSLRIRAIDLKQNAESCKYDDWCENSKCIDNQCGDGNRSKFPWLIVGLSIGGLAVVAVIVAFVTAMILRKKKENSSNNRRYN